MREEILDIAKKLYHNHLTIETGTDILLGLFNVSNALPIGTKVVYEGKKMKITNNREEFEGEPAYRCDYKHDELYLRDDFESIDLGNDC